MVCKPLDHSQASDQQPAAPGLNEREGTPVLKEYGPTRNRSEAVRPEPGGPMSRTWRPWERGARLERKDGVHEYPLDEQAILFDPETEMIYQLNEPAFLVWRKIEELSLGRLIEKLTEYFEVSNEVAAGHVRSFVQLLGVHGLIREVE